MVSIGTLWSTPTSTKGTRILATAAVAGLSLDSVPDYKHYEDNLKPEFLAKFPLGKVPAFEGKDGFRLFEASAIARYVASLAPEAKLLGQDAHEEALVDQWVSFSDLEHPTFSMILQICMGKMKPYSKTMYDAKVAEGTRAILTLEGHLASRTFFVGERLTLADITIAFQLQSLYKFFIDETLRKKTPNLLRFYETVINQAKLKEFYGEPTFCEKMITYQPPKKE